MQVTFDIARIWLQKIVFLKVICHMYFTMTYIRTSVKWIKICKLFAKMPKIWSTTLMNQIVAFLFFIILAMAIFWFFWWLFADPKFLLKVIIFIVDCLQFLCILLKIQLFLIKNVTEEWRDSDFSLKWLIWFNGYKNTFI